MTFANPIWLLLLLIVPMLVRLYRRGAKTRHVVLQMPDLQAFARSGEGLLSKLRRALPYFRWAAVGLLTVGMARPQKLWEEQKIKAEAIEIMLAMDISPSMLTKDFKPDRLAVSKAIASDFVQKREHDRLGLVAFSAEAFTQCPLTTDRRVVKKFISDLQIGRLQDGTAIGMGLATAVNRLKDSPAKSKIVILLTDGENNTGYIQPLDAAEIARTLDIRVYTIGLGQDGMALSPAQRDPYTGQYEFAMRNFHLDTELLEKIAERTQGRFFRAFSENDLAEVYQTIDQLEKTEIEVTTIPRRTEFYHFFVGAAILLLLLEVLLRWGVLKSIT